MEKFIIRPACPSEDTALSKLAIRSKAYWGYDQNFIDACRDELTYTALKIESPKFDFQVGEVASNIVAFYALEIIDSEYAELEAMFVSPEFIRRGIGACLLEHIKLRSQEKALGRVVIQADEFAAPFYQAMGAAPIGTRESRSISGRQLPVFEVTIDNKLSTQGTLV